MNTVDLIIRFYGLLISSSRFLSPIRFLVRKVADVLIPKLLKKEIMVSNKYLGNSSAKGKRIIVSFTSFPARIERVWVVVKCLKRQSVRPDKIILWLSKDQFDGIKLPDNLTSLIDDQFEIRMVDNDYRSHKKYLYAFKEYCDDIVVLVDDDIYYESRVIEKLLKGLETHPDAVICQFGSVMQYNKDGSLPPFTEWWVEKSEAIDSKDFFLGTGGGSLFMPNRLTKQILDIQLALKLTPCADDIWVNAMIRMSGLSIYKIKCGLLLQMSELQSSALKNKNSYEGQNDKQFKDLISYFETEKGVNPFSKRGN